LIRQFELVEKVKSYDEQADETLLNRAYVFAMRAHGTQTRASGDPYFLHPLEVANILTDMKLDSSTIATALLHDVIEDTGATTEELAELFGDKIAELVDGVTKLSKLEYRSESLRQAENFRKFLLAISHDLRVLLVKLADRLHNMRTLSYIKKPEKQRRIARETLEIYAPLAERLGMNEIKDELEQLSFQFMDPEAMQTITARMHYLIENNPTLEKDMVEALRALMAEHKINADVRGRIKQPYSIWRKMERQNVPFERLTDVMAFRLVVADVATCYQALGVIHAAFPMIPGRFKDYISLPKRNLYRSVHTSIIGPHKQRLEIQIRTQQMHEEAEYGLAAHWQYKQGAENKEGIQFQWVRELLEILEHGASPEEFLEHTKLAMYQDKVFCFTPKGELVSLPRGSTPVDFAYGVHTEIGDKCTGAMVNGRMVPLRHQLENGDQVKIITEEDAEPSERWAGFVVTGKASSAIKRYARSKKVSDFRAIGQGLIDKACQRHGLDYSDTVIKNAAEALNISDPQRVIEMVGEGRLSDNDVIMAAFPDYQPDEHLKALPRVVTQWKGANGPTVPLTGKYANELITLCDCCSPVKGDRVAGVLVPGKGIHVHRIECPNLDRYDDTPDAWQDLEWAERAEQGRFYVGRLRLEVVNERGALATIAAQVAKRGGNISNLEMTDRDPEFYIMNVDVEVRDLSHFSEISRTLQVSRVIGRVKRAEPVPDISVQLAAV